MVRRVLGYVHYRKQSPPSEPGRATAIGIFATAIGMKIPTAVARCFYWRGAQICDKNIKQKTMAHERRRSNPYHGGMQKLNNSLQLALDSARFEFTLKMRLNSFCHHDRDLSAAAHAPSSSALYFYHNFERLPNRNTEQRR